MDQSSQHLTPLGKILVVAAVFCALGGSAFWLSKRNASNPEAGQGPVPGSHGRVSWSPPEPVGLDAPVPDCMAETQTVIPKLAPAAAYQPKDGIVEIELSEYAGYAGLIAANGGLAPSADSVFAKKHGFRLKITLSEAESWNALNSGRLAASATTADVLAVYGRQFEVTVPAQIGYSRGADGVVVRSEIKRVNQLRGRTLATAQFTEADFFIRYLAQEAGMPVKMLGSLQEAPDSDSLNLVYCEDAFAAGDVFLSELKAGRSRLAGCVTWAPKTTEVAQQSGGKAHVMATNRNLLIIADVLVVNRGFAQQHPEMLRGLALGLLEGNRIVRDTPNSALDVVAGAFKWTREKATAEMAKIHFSNLPENLAFFSGQIDAAGSFGGIYSSSIYAYGPALIRSPVDGDRFLDLTALKAFQSEGLFKDQKIAIAPIRSTAPSSVEGDPLLSKDVRFYFEPNSAKLDMSKIENTNHLESLRDLLRVSPGSTILLRGHVDNAMIEEFRKQGGETFVRQMALKAMELSKNRAAEIKRALVETMACDAARLETVGRGWDEPAGPEAEKNRRVEAQWFTVE
ncbi:MAG: OmpA family protein [Planctomycetota bacterium]